MLIPPNMVERWLNKPIYISKYVYLDRWSFVHLASGMLLGYYFNIYIKVANAWLVVLLLSIIYEFFEYILWDVLFRKESFLNIWWDIKVNMIGFGIYWFLIR